MTYEEQDQAITDAWNTVPYHRSEFTYDIEGGRWMVRKDGKDVGHFQPRTSDLGTGYFDVYLLTKEEASETGTTRSWTVIGSTATTEQATSLLRWASHQRITEHD